MFITNYLIMKKRLLVVILTLLSITKLSARVNNLKDLLELSELSVYGLNDQLQYTWTVSRPGQFYIDNKTKITERYSFVYIKDGRDQVLTRAITVGVNDDFRYEVMDFMSNEAELLQRIKKNLPYQGYELIDKGDHLIYSDENTTISILEKATEEILLNEGYYLIMIY